MQDASLGIIINENRNVLLVLRKDVPFWVLPGGGIEDNESPQETCAREVLEESGVHVETLTHVATYSPINALASTTYIYSGLCPSAYEVRIQAQEVAQASFFPIDKLPPNIFIIHKLFLNDWQQAKVYPFFRVLSQVTYKAALFFVLRHPVLALKYLWTRMKNCISN